MFTIIVSYNKWARSLSKKIIPNIKVILDSFIGNPPEHLGETYNVEYSLVNWDVVKYHHDGYLPLIFVFIRDSDKLIDKFVYSPNLEEMLRKVFDKYLCVMDMEVVETIEPKDEAQSVSPLSFAEITEPNDETETTEMKDEEATKKSKCLMM